MRLGFVKGRGTGYGGKKGGVYKLTIDLKVSMIS